MEALKNKDGEFEGHGKHFNNEGTNFEQILAKYGGNHSIVDGEVTPTVDSLIMSTDGHMPTQSHQEGSSDPSRMNFNETLRSMQQSIEGLTRQFQSVARDVEELKKGKSSATVEQRVGDNLGIFNSPHH
ncbi:hypothetical protein M9H77_23309 [Catharanthus roseus]|uniref:Uncharacterized protein n=1 Tax=Catharanthus roseus TaxID=4058 RepID=A0ACC0ATC1_CATRO|nr:hypothetical protein M9H77_23309 [Catharanthus roseus]